MILTRRTLIVGGAAAIAAGRASAAQAPPSTQITGLRIKPDREAMVPVPGGRVYVRVNGDLAGARPPIVLIHGGPGSSHWYFLNATAMAQDRAVILYDQLDSGRSDRPGKAMSWTVARFVAELDAIRKALGVTRWHVLGASWGGTIALEYAAQRPAGLNSVVLQSPLISTPVWLRDARRLKDAMPRDVRAMLYACDKPGPSKADCDRATGAFYDRYVQRSDPSAAIEAYRKTMPTTFSDNVYENMWGRAEFTATGTLRHYEGRPLLDRLDGRRTLFLAGEYDEAIPATVATFARAVKGSTFRTIPKSAHVALIDNPKAYLAILRPWLARHDGVKV